MPPAPSPLAVPPRSTEMICFSLKVNSSHFTDLMNGLTNMYTPVIQARARDEDKDKDGDGDFFATRELVRIHDLRAFAAFAALRDSLRTTLGGRDFARDIVCHLRKGFPISADSVFLVLTPRVVKLRLSREELLNTDEEIVTMSFRPGKFYLVRKDWHLRFVEPADDLALVFEYESYRVHDPSNPLF